MKAIKSQLQFFLFSFLANAGFAQTDSVTAVNEIKKFQTELNDDFSDQTKSPLEKDDRKYFKGHEFFPINLKFRVIAKLKVTDNTPFFPMKATNIKVSEFRHYGVIEFSIDGEVFQVPVYQSRDLLKQEEYMDYLFFPFTDLTNGTETYSGGRFIGLRIPKSGKEIVVDFNQAYNPYCAYNSKYSCPLVPAENNLNVEIAAGVKYHSKK